MQVWMFSLLIASRKMGVLSTFPICNNLMNSTFYRYRLNRMGKH